ncbi:MAG: HigA family addiction module antitoxin [Janthinobacterium lividum]
MANFKSGPPLHPGEVLREEFMKPMNITGRALSHALGVTPARVADVVAEKRGITPDTALRLSVYFDTTPEFWMNLQQSYDLSVAFRESMDRIKATVHRRAAVEMELPAN